MSPLRTKVCCVCNIENSNTYYNLRKIDGHLNIEEKLDFCVPEIIEHKSLLSNSICKKCLKTLNTIYNFKLLCIKTHKSLFGQSKKKINEDEIFEPEIETEVKNEPLVLDNQEAIEEDLVTVYRVEVIKEVEENDNDNGYEGNLKQDLNRVAETLARYASTTHFADPSVDFEENENIFAGFTNQDIENTTEKSIQSLNLLNSLAVSEEKVSNHVVCKTCGIKFRSAKNCREHELEHEEEQKPKICVICMKILGPHSTLKDHIHDHFSKTKKRTCDICNKSFPTASKMQFHKSVVHEKFKHVCRFCNKYFTSKLSLTTHMNSHRRLDEELFACFVCGKKFTNRLSRDRHFQLVHEKIKPYSCHLCDKKFGLKQNLKKHLDVHTGLKPFECSICNKHFRYQLSLTHHYKVHKKHKCPLCDECFMSFKQMRQHERQHRSDLPYHCNFCKLKFKLASHLSNHISRKHKEDIKPFLK